jgi:hypothetical protein
MEKYKIPSFAEKPCFNIPLIDDDDRTPQDYRDWLLFYSLPCLQGHLPSEQLLQHGLLVESIYLLLKSEVTEIERKRAEKLLAEYSKTLSNNCPEFRSMNLHKHLHFAESVKHLGPLWAHSTLMFNDANYTIKTTLTETSKTGEPNCLKPAGQLSYAIDTLNDCLSMELLKQVNKMKSKPEEFLLSVPIRPTSTLLKSTELAKIGSAKDAKFFGICKARNVAYHSVLFVKKNQSEDSYYVAYKDPKDKLTKHAVVIAFILSGVRNGNKKYFAGKRVLLKEAAYKTSLGCKVNHIRKFSLLEEFVCEEVKYLRKPLYHIGNLLAEPPNMVEIY